MSCIPGLWLHLQSQSEFSADHHRCIVVVGLHCDQMLEQTLGWKNRWNTDLMHFTLRELLRQIWWDHDDKRIQGFYCIFVRHKNIMYNEMQWGS